MSFLKLFKKKKCKHEWYYGEGGEIKMLDKIIDIFVLLMTTVIFSSVGIVVLQFNLGFEKSIKIVLLLMILSTMLAWEYRDVDCLKEW